MNDGICAFRPFTASRSSAVLTLARLTAAGQPQDHVAIRRISGAPRWSWRVPFRDVNCVQFGQLVGGHLTGFVVADEVPSSADAGPVHVAAGLGRVLDDSGAALVVEIGVHSGEALGLCGLDSLGLRRSDRTTAPSRGMGVTSSRTSGSSTSPSCGSPRSDKGCRRASTQSLRGPACRRGRTRPRPRPRSPR